MRIEVDMSELENKSKFGRKTYSFVNPSRIVIDDECVDGYTKSEDQSSGLDILSGVERQMSVIFEI